MVLENLQTILKDQPSYRLKQAQEAIFKILVSDWSQATNLPKNLQEKLNQEMPLALRARTKESRDGRSIKASLKLKDGLEIETVLMSYDSRHTVCVSSQVGCPVGCEFCLTGQMGFKRNLTAEEILDQILFFARILKEKGERVSNVVFMGMGEPFLNMDEVLKAINIINDPLGLNIGARSISVSTVGIIEGIKKLADFSLQINLAVSLQAPNDGLRSKLVPLNKKYPIKDIFKALEEYIAKTNRKAMIEYVMIVGVNDRIELAEQLAVLIKSLPKPLCMVNLICCNPTGKFKPSSKKQMEDFQKVLLENKVEAVIRESLGQDIYGACGQLASN
ncbi:MAG: 23S rRNA (adenine(2503)-C(2))-methyltransferase RlmN [Patescibacteria group bacterium]